MLRLIATVLSLALVVGSMDAAMHFDALLGAHGPHERHGQLHDPGELAADDGGPEAPVPDGDTSGHFCHCAAHSPAMLGSFEVPLLALPQRVVAAVPDRRAEGVHWPPLRPPNLA